jgi:hypothetical protein
MIVGSITELSHVQDGSQTNFLNGAASVVFYTELDAEQWCRKQSEAMVYGTNNRTIIALCNYINTDTGVRRWWFNGTEYTA